MDTKLVKCDITNDLMYVDDAIPTKKGFVCIFGKFLVLKKRFENLQSKRFTNFIYYMSPYLLIILGIISVYIGGFFEYIALGFIGLALIIIGINAVQILNHHGLVDEIGDPEKTIYEYSGTINLETGYVDGSIRTYDAYSAEQWVGMIFNLIKFSILFVVLAAIGWIIWIIYLVRKRSVKKKTSALYNTYMTDNLLLTSMLICDGNAENFEDVEIAIKNGEEIIGSNLNFYRSFFVDDKIYGIFFEKDNDDNFFFVEVMPGYDNKLIVDDEKKEYLLAQYYSIVEGQ